LKAKPYLLRNFTTLEYAWVRFSARILWVKGNSVANGGMESKVMSMVTGFFTPFLMVISAEYSIHSPYALSLASMVS